MTNQLLEITLTNQEKEIFKLMTSTITHHKLQTVVRVAGGWVRDKLLGLTSDDIDFTISDMTGEKFGNYVLKYLEFVGVEQFALPKLRINPQKKPTSWNCEVAAFRFMARPLSVKARRVQRQLTNTESDSRHSRARCKTKRSDDQLIIL
eukprot:Anaeramoba_flamelloidesc36400_g1_i1.p1 GENE.c36400_g1_i1~~c36400_g1_i1.p1  ORF type:complete len:149 (+),score=16.21 c36400_g1_i1:43-489(+)